MLDPQKAHRRHIDPHVAVTGQAAPRPPPGLRGHRQQGQHRDLVRGDPLCRGTAQRGCREGASFHSRRVPVAARPPPLRPAPRRSVAVAQLRRTRDRGRPPRQARRRVLPRIYAHCIDGQADAANQRITAALSTQDPQAGGPSDEEDNDSEQAS
jgi:hypothetical protein